MNKTVSTTRPVLLMTYFSGINGCCPAEWADDKIDSLGKLGRKTVLISGVGSRRERSPGVVHYRVPSISYTDWKTERNELRSTGQGIPLSMYLMLPFALTFGALLDFIQGYLTRGVGGGKWSWLIPSFLAGVYACLRYRCGCVFTTGGPASAHLAGLAVGVVCRRKVVSELQDPLSGNEIGRNSRSAQLLGMVEGLVCRYADKVVYVTQKAAEEASHRFNATRIESIYPGARRFPAAQESVVRPAGAPLRFVHLGTLYSTRNMTTLIAAVDKLIAAGRLHSDEIEIVNLGEIYGDIKAHHLAKDYVRQFPICPREEALNKARTYDVSLLIQHTDDRSNLTIPYKTYDYLNLGNPILALTNNPELNGMLESFGHYAVSVNDVDAVSVVIESLVRGDAATLSRGKVGGFDAPQQCKKLLAL